MARPMHACAAFVAIGLCAAGAWGTPILDGTVDPNEYDFVVFDDPNDNLAGIYESGLNITDVRITFDSNHLHVGLSTETTFDPSGSDAHSWGQTWVRMRFFDSNVAGPLKHDMLLMVQGGGPNSFLLLMDGNMMVQGTHYWTQLGDAFEFKLDRSQLLRSLGDTFAFEMHLDDTGDDQDDYIAAVVPEPATVSLLAIAGVAVLRRRRRR